MTMYFAKKLNKKGFTLAELLIVVAIIAVLVAIAVPIFTNSLEKSRYAVHSSNGRAMKSLAVAELLGSNVLADETLTGEDYWAAYGTYDFSKEEMELVYITPISKPTSVGAGMWMKKSSGTAAVSSAANLKTVAAGLTANDGSKSADSNLVQFVPNNDGYKTIGRVGTGTNVKVEYIIIFTNVDISDLEIAS